MKKLILHIGSHKTGSTSIQKAMFLYSNLLRELNFNPILEDKDGEEVFSNLGCFFKGNSGFNCDFLSNGASLKNQFFTFLKERSDLYPNSTDILSSEEFSFITSKSHVEQLSDKLKDIYDDIRIIVYIRRQDRQLVSHYQQASRAPGATTYIYGNEPLAIPHYKKELDVYLDYYTRIGLWADVFGDDNIELISFDDISLSKTGLINDFFVRIGVDLEVPEIRDNSSFGKITTKVKHMSMIEGFTREESFIFNNLFENDKEKLVPSLLDAKAIFDKYEDSNRKLVDRFNLDEKVFFSPKFNYPECSNEQWTEDEANQVIRALLRLLKDKI